MIKAAAGTLLMYVHGATAIVHVCEIFHIQNKPWCYSKTVFTPDFVCKADAARYDCGNKNSLVQLIYK